MVLPISNTGLSGPAKKGTRQMDFNSTIKRMVKRAALVGAGACVMAVGACAPVYANEGTPVELIQGWVTVDTGAPVDVSGTPACEDEGQEYGPCLWDAAASGNRSGDSFIVEEDGSVTYIRKQDGTAVGQDVKKKGKKKAKAAEDSEAPAPAPTEAPEARAFPGWEWTGVTTPVEKGGLPFCADVYGQQTCWRDGYVLLVDNGSCTQTIVTDSGNQYVPGATVAAALSDACKARKEPTPEHENNAGLGGSRSTEGVRSASPSAAVNKRVGKSASPSATATVGSVDSPREVVAAPAAPVKDNYDHEILGGIVALGLLGLAGAGLVSVVDRVRGWRRGR